MRDVVARFDFCSYLLVLLCLAALAKQAARFVPRFAKAMWWAGTGVLLGLAGYAYAELRPQRADEVIAILGVAAIAGCAAALVVAVVLTPLAAAGDWLAGRVRAWQTARRQRAEARELAERQEREAENRRREQAERSKAEEERQRAQPRPPTRDELAAAARDRYERTVRMVDAAGLDAVEAEAARERAKQKYLAELERLME